VFCNLMMAAIEGRNM